MKRLFGLLLSFALVVSLVPTAFATTPEATQAANALYSQGLFNGTGKDTNGNPIFELDRAPTRHEAVTMLVRLLGKEAEAQSGTWTTPFTDVANWAKPYVGYAYTNGLTNGTSATTFSGEQTVSASEYLTFVLRTLGYTSGTDFQWDRAWELSDKIGLTDGRYNEGTVDFTRGDVAIISNSALDCRLKGKTYSLSERLPENQTQVTSNNFAPDTLKYSIMDTITNGLISWRSGLENCLNAAKFLSMGYNKYTIQYSKESQEKFQSVLTTFRTAITQCGNYDDTQTTKTALVTICDNISSLCAYEITDKNFIDYLVDEAIISNKVQSYINIIVSEGEAWADDIN